MMPTAVHAIAKEMRAGNWTLPAGSNRATISMSEAIQSASATGGILSSKEFIS